MNATVMDTLRFANRLKEAGFETPQAEGMARALGDELMERMVTKSDLDAMEAKFEGKFDAMESRFDAMEAKFDAKFDAVEGKFDAVEARFEAMEGRFEAMEGKFDAKFEGVDAKIDSVHRELSGKFNILLGVMALGFTLLFGLGGYNAVAPRLAGSIEETSPVAEARQAAPAPLAPQSIAEH